MLGERLIQMGFNASEAKVYLELLNIGSQPVSIIAKRVNINRTTTYAILRGLSKKGVVSSFLNGAVRIFRANDPNCLVAYLDGRARTLEYYKDEILLMIPKLRQMSDSNNFRQPLVSFFEGIDGVQQVICDALNVKGDFYMYICEHMQNFPIIGPKANIKAIAPDTQKVRAFFERHHMVSEKNPKVLYVKDEEKFPLFGTQMSIYGNKIAIVHLNPGSEHAILIESPEVANMQRAVFEAAWEGLV